MQLEELINLSVSFALFLYLLGLVRGKEHLLPRTWIAGMICMLVNQVSTVAEAFFLAGQLNALEHFSSMTASFLFLVGSFRYGREEPL